MTVWSLLVEAEMETRQVEAAGNLVFGWLCPAWSLLPGELA